MHSTTSLWWDHPSHTHLDRHIDKIGKTYSCQMLTPCKACSAIEAVCGEGPSARHTGAPHAFLPTSNLPDYLLPALLLTHPWWNWLARGSTKRPVHPWLSSNQRLFEFNRKSSAPASTKNPPFTRPLKMNSSRN